MCKTLIPTCRVKLRENWMWEEPWGITACFMSPRILG
jgi:hypothetical protein